MLIAPAPDQFQLELTVLGIDFYVILDATGVVASSFEPISGHSPNRGPTRQSHPEAIELEEQVRYAVYQYEMGNFDPLGAVLRSSQSRSPGFYGTVQDAVDSISYGSTVSYAQLAMIAENPRAHRAAASACAKNPLPLFRPCHRVIKSDGTIGGFGFDIGIKAALLAHEEKVPRLKSSQPLP